MDINQLISAYTDAETALLKAFGFEQDWHVLPIADYRGYVWRLSDRVVDWASDDIDRLDNSLGYTLANSVPCCNQCNLSKKNYSLTEFIEWVRRVNAHWGDKCPE